MIYIFITERGQQERLLGSLPSQELAEQAAQRLVQRPEGSGPVVVDRAVVCQQLDEDQLVTCAVFERQS